MTLTALRPVWGSFCTDKHPVAPGATFEADQQTAEHLIASGMAKAVHYETKVITPAPQEVKPLPATPFRDVPRADEESPALAALVAAVRAVSNVPAERDLGRIERDTRDGPDTAVSEASAPTGESDHRSDSKRRMRRRAR